MKIIVIFVFVSFCIFAAQGHPQPESDQILLPDVTENEIVSNKPRASNQGSYIDRSRLMNDLLTKYNKLVNPDNVKLQFGVNLVDFRVRQEINAIESYVWLRYEWKDHRLSWDPEQYGGVQALRIDSSALWKPDVTLYNGVDTVNMINCWEHNTIVKSDGKVNYIPPCKLTSQCAFTLWKHPYGDQTCSMKFGSWTFDGNMLDLQFYNATQGVDLSQNLNSSGFTVVSTTGERHERYYPCCKEPYLDLTFNLTIRRIPTEERFGNLV